MSSKVECFITGHLRSCNREYFEYQLWNIFWMKKDKSRKEFYFILIIFENEKNYMNFQRKK
jgi:hypothetical protein